MLENSIKKHIKQLHQKKYRREFGEFLVEGVKGVEEALNSEMEVVAVIMEGSRREEPVMANIIKIAGRNRDEVFFAGRKDLPLIKTTDTFPGVMAIVMKSQFSLGDIMNAGPIVCIDGINDPGNLGTIIRTSDWFGVPNILLGARSVDIYNEKVVRSTMGSFFREKIFRSGNLVESLGKLKNEGYSVYALEMSGNKLKDLKLNIKDKTVLVFGSESHGISDEVKRLCEKSYTIEKRGEAESLNLGIAVGIVLSTIK